MAETKVVIKEIDADKLREFFERADIGEDSPQTFKLSNEKIVSRAYPSSKSFVVNNSILWKDLTEKEINPFSVELPCMSVSKLIKCLKFFKGQNINLTLECKNGKVGSTGMSFGKKRFKVKSGAIGSIPPFQPDEISANLFSTENSMMVMELSADSIETISKMHDICKEDNKDTTIQLIYEDGEMNFSSVQTMSEQIGDDWKYSEGIISGEMSGEKHVVDSRFIAKMKGYDNKVYFREWNKDTKLMIFVNDVFSMVCVVLKSI